MREGGERKYLFLFLDIIQSQCSKYRLDFYFKPEEKIHKSLINIAQHGVHKTHTGTYMSVAVCFFFLSFF